MRAPDVVLRGPRVNLTESKFFQSSSRGLGKEEVDDNDLKRNPRAVRKKPTPFNVLKANRVDIGREEAGTSTEELKH
jgi:hypothetical protein